ncbi:FkbM family methyltransferase [Actinokineospora bangkokensis]|uniref:FkbM family methyltransferase n=1 Tax=Actinokineospora bangkokensis TaxID=1193682 RepID=UPI001300F554|nr:FkbM family methyltransferase [Actinokineospora bangkokensis]
MNDHETEHLRAEIFDRRAYLPPPLSLPPGAVVVDVGANIGVFSLFALAESPGATVYACEPVPQLVDVLRRNLAPHPSAHVLPIGLSDVDEDVEFTYHPGFTTMSAQTAHADVRADRDLVARTAGVTDPDEAAVLAELVAHRFRAVPVRARVRRLSGVLTELGVNSVDLLKVDVQRAEAAVLRGLDPAHWAGVRQVVVEVHDAPGPTAGRLAEVVGRLRALGFEVRAEQEPALAGSDRYTAFAHRAVARRGGGERS